MSVRASFHGDHGTVLTPIQNRIALEYGFFSTSTLAHCIGLSATRPKDFLTGLVAFLTRNFAGLI
jgi:hypothetical protein